MAVPSDDPRRERWIIGGWTLVGAILRGWNPARIGLEHFDEGVYAVAALWVQNPPRGQPFIDPDAALYAPPGLVTLIAAAYTLLGASDRAAIFVSWLAGTLVIPVGGWIGRRWFGTGAGAAAAALIALSGPHVAFSRMALTDATFLLTWLIAVAAGQAFLAWPGFGSTLVMGIAVGAAQLVKYNGWLAGVVVASACLVGVITRAPGGRRMSLRALAWGPVGALVAALVYLPWFRFVDRHIGYGSLLEHHRSYIDGWTAWPRNWLIQVAEMNALAGPMIGPIGWGSLAYLGASIGLLAARRGPPLSNRAKLRLLVGSCLLGLIPELAWWIGLAILPALLRSGRPGDRMLAGWWLVLSVLTPLYHPYARLWLPLHAAGWLCLARWIAIRAEEHEEVPARAAGPAWGFAVIAAGCLVHASLLHTARPAPDLLGPTDGVRSIVRGFARRQVASGPPARHPSAYVLARPSAVFYLIEEGFTPRRLDHEREVGPHTGLGLPILIDEAQAPGWAEGQGGAGAAPFESENLPPTTRLDLDPDSAFRAQSDRPIRFWAIPPHQRPPGIR